MFKGWHKQESTIITAQHFKALLIHNFDCVHEQDGGYTYIDGGING